MAAARTAMLTLVKPKMLHNLSTASLAVYVLYVYSVAQRKKITRIFKYNNGLFLVARYCTSVIGG